MGLCLDEEDALLSAQNDTIDVAVAAGHILEHEMFTFDSFQDFLDRLFGVGLGDRAPFGGVRLASFLLCLIVTFC